jgi:hypothetical protein
MLFPLLSFGGLMTVEATDAPFRVNADFKLMHDRVLLLRVAFGALSRRANELGRGLFRVARRARPIEDKSADHERERDDDGDEDGPERHLRILA